MNITMAVLATEILDQTDDIYICDGGLPQKPTPPWNYSLFFNIEGLTNFFIDINDSNLKVEEGDHSDPKLTLTFDSYETMESVFSGDQAAAMQAFMTGKVKFDGDMTLGQKLGSVFKAPE